MAWSRDDMIAGAVFLGSGLVFGGTTLLSLDVGTPAEMGPGFFPLALCGVLVVLGAAILWGARDRTDEAAPPLNLRAVVLVIAAPVVFGLTIRTLGLVPALLISLGLAVAARPRIGALRGAAIVLGVTAFCVGVFAYGLRVPVDLVNPNFIH